MTRKDFAVQFAILQEVRDFTVSKNAVPIWFAAVEHLPSEVWAKAVADFLQQDTTTFKPTPAAVLRYAGLYGLTPEERANLIWGKVCEAISAPGRVQFDDPAANLAIRNDGGWLSYRNGPNGELHFRKQSFTKAYAACVRAGKGDHRPLGCLPNEVDSPVTFVQTGLPALANGLPLATAPSPVGRIGGAPQGTGLIVSAADGIGAIE